MSGSETFLTKDPAELQEFLLGHARSARAPRPAQQRLLAQLTSGALGAGLTLSATEALGAGVARATPWLVGKWILVGMSASLLTFAAGERVERALSLRHLRAPALVVAPPLRAPAASPAALEPQALEPAVGTAPAEPTDAPRPSAALKASKASALAAALPGSAEPPSADAAAQASAALTREVGMLKGARALLAAGDAAAALQALDAYAQAFPAGSLAVEAAALRVETVAKLGNRALAEQLAREFLEQHGSSPLGPRVRAVGGVAP